jgi:hypothetical protein
MDAAEVMVCARCGARAEGPVPPLTWVMSVERGRQLLFCEECGRTHLRAIESKLDSEWW